MWTQDCRSKANIEWFYILVFILCKSPVKMSITSSFSPADTDFTDEEVIKLVFLENKGTSLSYVYPPFPHLTCCKLNEYSVFDVLWSSHIDALHDVWMGTQQFHSAHFEELLISGWRPLNQLFTCTVFIYLYAFQYFYS